MKKKKNKLSKLPNKDTVNQLYLSKNPSTIIPLDFIPDKINQKSLDN